MTLNGIAFTRTKDHPHGAWRWKTNPTVAEIVAGAVPRKATAAETRRLNRMIADNPPAMSAPGVHPSYRV